MPAICLTKYWLQHFSVAEDSGKIITTAAQFLQLSKSNHKTKNNWTAKTKGHKQHLQQNYTTSYFQEPQNTNRYTNYIPITTTKTCMISTPYGRKKREAMGHLMNQKIGKPQNGQELVTEKHGEPSTTALTIKSCSIQDQLSTRGLNIKKSKN